ncbi:pyridoxamine 5'-phosphate oxidase family protein [Paenibacillus sp. UMB4589-SE434]|uniref:pyridoxamine 5'-phosphate oxidase family protein n=1 Tax=Paenibacillus sp. UMB4589-SE434 TaxID=3046314 RepID=UPI00254C3C41|nr:pyridoxamine 5'-phosphate oxidase family protein [Paenibacillus sp. UMB4589-SE434]MDK8183627.1 pyridoxamine 5'-phosphate oxidase family protein [Paenibacillus sp. UMB4589-SE434]
MRRAEFEVEGQELINDFLKEQPYGVLGTMGDDSYPRLTPIMYIHMPEQHALYFHSSRKGEKIEQLKKHPQASFNVSEMHALIPSHFVDPVFACPATTYFRSVHIRGTMSIVSDSAEKTKFFTAFMEKLQPEGGYEPFDWSMSGYAKQDAALFIYKLNIEDLTAKFKFGQNLPEKKHQMVKQGLADRQAPGDAETIAWMEKLDVRRCPFS